MLHRCDATPVVWLPDALPAELGKKEKAGEPDELGCPHSCLCAPLCLYRPALSSIHAVRLERVQLLVWSCPDKSLELSSSACSPCCARSEFSRPAGIVIGLISFCTRESLAICHAEVTTLAVLFHLFQDACVQVHDGYGPTRAACEGMCGPQQYRCVDVRHLPQDSFTLPRW